MAVRYACLPVLVLALNSACASLHDAVTARPATAFHERSILPKHTFRKGEAFHYIFENTEARYATTATNATARPTDLTSLEEISVSIRVDVISSGSLTTKRVTLTDVVYRKQSAADLSSGRPFVGANTLVPGLERPLSYTYQVSRNDGEVESQLASFFGEVRTTEIGSFLLPVSGRLGYATSTDGSRVRPAVMPA